jgi:hypothetical protein
MGIQSARSKTTFYVFLLLLLLLLLSPPLNFCLSVCFVYVSVLHVLSPVLSCNLPSTLMLYCSIMYEKLHVHCAVCVIGLTAVDSAHK